MQLNEGSIDRVMRIVIGLVLLSLVVAGPHSLWGLLGLVPLLTGIWGFCPLCRAIGISSCPTRAA